MVDKKEKIINYRRAEWLIPDSTSASLESHLKHASQKLLSVKDRTIERGAQLLKLAKLTPAMNGGFYLHITAETPGEAASIVPNVAGATAEVDVSTSAPPLDTEFMDGDAFLYINGDDVCVCTTGIHESTVKYFLHRFFIKAAISNDSEQFDLLKIANINKIKLIESEGVKEIELRSMLYEATLKYQKRKTQAMSLLSAIAAQFRAVLTNEDEGDAAEDAIHVQLHINVDNRHAKGTSIGAKKLSELALNIVNYQEDGDDYIIVTKSGQRISPTEIFIRRKVEIESKGKSVDRDGVWQELDVFYKSLSSSGALEE